MNHRNILRTKEAFLKVKTIEWEFSKGTFDNIDWFLMYSGSNAINYALEWACFYGQIELVKKIVDKGGNANASNMSGLQMASKNGHIDVVKWLLENGQMNNLPSWIILAEAVENNHTNIVEYLLMTNQYDIPWCDVRANEDIAIRTAVESENIDMVKLLIKFGANVNIFDGYCLSLANQKNNLELIKVIIDAIND